MHFVREILLRNVKYALRRVIKGCFRKKPIEREISTVIEK